MFDYIVQINDYEDRVKADTRAKAIGSAIRQYKRETGSQERFMSLFAIASCTKVGGRKRGEIK